MLELRRRDGNITAIGYAWIERIDFDPSHGITIHALGQRIQITGVNLNAEVQPNRRLFEGLTRHRVSWIAETDPPPGGSPAAHIAAVWIVRIATDGAFAKS